MFLLLSIRQRLGWQKSFKVFSGLVPGTQSEVAFVCCGNPEIYIGTNIEVEIRKQVLLREYLGESLRTDRPASGRCERDTIYGALLVEIDHRLVFSSRLS